MFSKESSVRTLPTNIGRRITFFLRLIVSTKMPSKTRSSETCWATTLAKLKKFLGVKLTDSNKNSMKDNSPLDVAAREVGRMCDDLLRAAKLLVKSDKAKRLTSISIAVAFGQMFEDYQYSLNPDKQLEGLKEAANKYMDGDDFKEKDDQPIWSKRPASWMLREFVAKKGQKERDADLTLALCALLYSVDMLNGASAVAKVHGRKGAVASEVAKVVNGLRREVGKPYPESMQPVCVDTAWVNEMKRPFYAKNPEKYKKELDKYVKSCGPEALQALASKFLLKLPDEYMKQKAPRAKTINRYNMRT